VQRLDLRAATARRVQQLRFIEFDQWFPPRRDERASEGFYTVLQEDFYTAFALSGVALRSHRVCQIRDIVAATGEQIRPYLTYLPGLADLMGRSGSYVAEWVRQFYASLWIDPGHRFIHFAVGGRDHRLYGNLAREILMVPDDSIKLH